MAKLVDGPVHDIQTVGKAIAKLQELCAAANVPLVLSEDERLENTYVTASGLLGLHVRGDKYGLWACLWQKSEAKEDPTAATEKEMLMQVFQHLPISRDLLA